MVSIKLHELGGDWVMIEQNGGEGTRYNIARRGEGGMEVYRSTAALLSGVKHGQEKSFIDNWTMCEMVEGVEDYLEYFLIWGMM